MRKSGGGKADAPAHGAAERSALAQQRVLLVVVISILQILSNSRVSPGEEAGAAEGVVARADGARVRQDLEADWARERLGQVVRQRVCVQVILELVHSCGDAPLRKTSIPK